MWQRAELEETPAPPTPPPRRLSQALALSVFCSPPNARDPQEDERQMQCWGSRAHGVGVRAKPDFVGGEGTARRPSSPRRWGSRGPPSVSD